MDWDFSNDQFEDDERTTAINDATIKIIETTEEVLKEMKEHLELNERHNFQCKLTYLMNRFSQLMILANVEDAEQDYTDEEIAALIAEAEMQSTTIDYNKLFAMTGDDSSEPKRGLDILDYLKKDDNSDDFDF